MYRMYKLNGSHGQISKILFAFCLEMLDAFSGDERMLVVDPPIIFFSHRKITQCIIPVG